MDFYKGIDSSLSEIGVQQAEAAGLYLQDVHFTNVFASDMKRAQQTAEIILRKNKTSSNLDIVTHPSLKERNFGTAEGGSVQSMRDMAREAGQTIPEFTPPGGETMDQVKERIGIFLRSMFKLMADQHPTSKSRPDHDVQADGPHRGHPDEGVHNVSAHALVVSHGAYMRVAVRHFIEDLKCSVPPGSKTTEVYAACPNTGMSRFLVTLRCGDAGAVLSSMKCVFINRREHIRSGV